VGGLVEILKIFDYERALRCPINDRPGMVVTSQQAGAKWLLFGATLRFSDGHDGQRHHDRNGSKGVVNANPGPDAVGARGDIQRACIASICPLDSEVAGPFAVDGEP
jgi:hypothetical protein